MNPILKKYTFWNNIDNQLSQNFDFSQTPISELAEKSKHYDYLSNHSNTYLHDSIFKFYAYNELLSSYRTKNNGIIDNEDLNLYSDYQEFINDFSKRIFSFILYSSLTECKYSQHLNSNDKNVDFKKNLVEAYIDYEISNIDYSVNFVDMEGLDNSELDNSKDKDKIFKYFIKINKVNDDLSLTELVNSDKKKLKKEMYSFIESYFYIYEFIERFISPSFKENFSQTYVHQDKNKAYNYFSETYPDIIKDKNKFSTFFEFIRLIKNSNFNDNAGNIARNIVATNEVQNSLSNFTTQEVFEYISIFFLDKFEIGYGNKAWSDIAKHALSFSKGEINAEVFIDQALSMEHNNGNMFNKNYIFEKRIPEGNTHILYKDSEGSLEFRNLEITINDFVLHMQNSGSVLSSFHLLNKDWYNLNEKENFNTIKENYKKMNKYSEIEYFEKLKSNFDLLNGFALSIKDLEPMLKIAKKINYSVPEFNWGNICSLIADKAKIDLFKNNKNDNNIFCDILNSNKKLIKKSINKIKFEPVFQLHDLNSHNSKGLTKELIGGKAHGLTTLINKGFNVPKAFVFDTKTCLSYIENKKFFNKEYKGINQQISDYLIDDNKKPLLVSVRSGAPVSMPGMMDSILNVGIDDSTYPQLCKNYTKKVIDDCAISFMQQFCSSKLNLDVKFPKNLHKALDKFAETLIKNDIDCNRKNTFPLSKEEQIKLSIEAVFDSWNSHRAIAWRNEKNISHNMGTAATVQQMVFGNKNDKSLTCVIFSRDCITGKPDIMGEYLPQAQGEDLVAGKKTPLPISHLKISNPKVYKEIEFIAKTLEEEQKFIQDIEITVEDGKVYVLQMRNAVVSPEAQLALAKDMNLNLLDVIQPKMLIGDAKVDTLLEHDYNGLAGSPGLISGIIVRNQEDIDKYKNEGKDLIFFSNQALPEHAPIMIATQGFITEVGGATSHAAILARSMGKPCVVGIGKQNEEVLESGSLVTIDASEGKIWKGELPIVISQEQAINLANQLVVENEINLKDYIPNKFIMHNWVKDLSIVKIIPEKQGKHKMFLNISQQVALSLQKTYVQETMTKFALN